MLILFGVKHTTQEVLEASLNSVGERKTDTAVAAVTARLPPKYM